jgi:hypothetical protein
VLIVTEKNTAGYQGGYKTITIQGILLIFYMAATSRLCGGAWPKLPSFTDQALFALPFAAITYVLLPDTGVITCVLSALAGITALLGKLTGHGRGISLYEPMRGDPERVEIVIRWLEPHLPTWAYKCLILALCEAVVWAGIAVAISPWLLLAALIRPAAYIIGWGIWLYAENNGLIRRTQTAKNKSVKRISFLPDYLGVHTAIGEFLTGAFSGVVLGLVIG